MGRGRLKGLPSQMDRVPSTMDNHRGLSMGDMTKGSETTAEM